MVASSPSQFAPSPANTAQAGAWSGWLLVLTAVFITYGSLYPFSFIHPTSFSWNLLSTGWLRAGSRGDFLANLGLFIPYGFFGMIYVLARRRPAAIVLLLLAGLVLSVALQYAQIWLPSRTPAAGDALWNVVGIILGAVLGYLATKIGARGSVGTRFHFQLSDMAIVLAVMAFEWLPFIPTLDFQTFKDNVKPLFGGRGINVPELIMHATVMYIGGFTLCRVFAGHRRAILFALIALFALLTGRAFIVTAGLDWSVALGAIAGLVLTAGLSRLVGTMQETAFMWIVFLALITAGLWPFQLKFYPSTFGWLPFAGFLTGDAIGTARSLLGQAILFFSFFVLIQRIRGSLVASILVLGLTMLGIEWAQLYLVGRSGDITPLALVILGAILARVLCANPRARVDSRVGGLARGEPVSSATSRPPSPVLPHHPGAERPLPASRKWRPVVALIAGMVVMSIGMWAALRVPNVPYNVRELFRGNGSLFALVLFSVALVLPGLVSRVIGSWLDQMRRAGLALPLLVLAAGASQLAFLYLSVSEESIADIAGSNNLYWFVTNRETWGVWWKHVFLIIESPGLIGFFERIVRFTALFGPVVVVLASFFAFSSRVDRGQRVDVPWAASLLLSAVMTMALFKFIAFDRSSTDNLNELIARDGFFGAGGGAYLYALLILICLNIWTATKVRIKSPLRLFACVAFVTLSLPAGWALLQAGLEQHVVKYGSVFSGQQFLLGPDRKALLPEAVLMLRWWIIQLAIVFVTTLGARVGSSLIEAWNAGGGRVRPATGLAR